MQNPWITSYLGSERLKAFPLKLRTRQRCLFPPVIINIVLELPPGATGQEKEIKDIQIRKEELKLISVHRSPDLAYGTSLGIDMHTQKLLELINHTAKLQNTGSIYKN